MFLKIILVRWKCNFILLLVVCPRFAFAQVVALVIGYWLMILLCSLPYKCERCVTLCFEWWCYSYGCCLMVVMGMICEGCIFLGCSLGIELECGEIKFWSLQTKMEVHIQRNKWNHQSPLFIYIMSIMSLSVMCMTSFVEDCIFHSINSFLVKILIGMRTSNIYFLVKENIKYK